MGTGIGSIPIDRLVKSVEDLMQATVPSGFAIATKAFPLSKVETVRGTGWQYPPRRISDTPNRLRRRVFHNGRAVVRRGRPTCGLDAAQKVHQTVGIKYTVLLDVETSTAKDTLRRPSTGTPGPRHSTLPLHGIKLQERKVQSPLTHCRSHRIAPYHHRHSLVERPLALFVVPYREET